MYDAVDIFPVDFSESLAKLEYPEANFKYWSNDPDIRAFVLFANSQNKIYYSKKVLNEPILNNVMQIGKECKKFLKFYPRNINFTKVANRYRINPCDEGKKNADVRLGFKLKNTFLVKAFFTFGLRRVEEGSAHVIQTLNVPLLMYIHPKKAGKICRDGDRVFPFEDLHVYDLSILQPHGVYRIAPGVKYVLLSTQKNFFGLDVVPESMEIPFDHSDPVRRRVTRLPGMYDRPVKTPYIEHVDLSGESNDSDESAKNNPARQDDFYEFFQTEPFKSEQQQPEGDVCLAQTSEENARQQQQQPQQQQNVTYWLIPNPPALEKSVVRISVDFAKAYRELMEVENLAPPLPKKPLVIPDHESYQREPLDLSRRRFETVDLAGAEEMMHVDCPAEEECLGRLGEFDVVENAETTNYPADPIQTDYLDFQTAVEENCSFSDIELDRLDALLSEPLCESETNEMIADLFNSQYAE